VNYIINERRVDDSGGDEIHHDIMIVVCRSKHSTSCGILILFYGTSILLSVSITDFVTCGTFTSYINPFVPGDW
jgi:hypothetical protein